MDRVDSKDEILSGSVSYRGITYESDDKLMARVFNLPARRRPNVKSAYNEHMSKAERQRLELEKAERIFTRAYYERRATETFKVGDSSSSHFSVSTDEPGAREPGELPHIGQYSPQSGLSNGNSAPFTLPPISGQLGDINHLPEPSVTADSGDRLHSRIARRERREPIYATYEDGGLLGNLYGKQGDGPGHRGRTIIGGVALGAIDAETITGARSRYRERPAKSTVSKGPVYDDFTTLGAAIDTVRAINKLRERPGRMMNGVVSTSPPPLPRTNNDSGVGGMGLGDDLQRYGLPPLPATLVAGIDPMIAQEISDRIYNEKRASYNENSARDRYQSSPQSQQNRSHPLSYHEAAQPFVPVDFGSLSAGFGQLANQQWKSSRTQTSISSTISKDNTCGESARQAKLLAEFGRKRGFCAPTRDLAAFSFADNSDNEGVAAEDEDVEEGVTYKTLPRGLTSVERFAMSSAATASAGVSSEGQS